MVCVGNESAKNGVDKRRRALRVTYPLPGGREFACERVQGEGRESHAGPNQFLELPQKLSHSRA